MRTLVVALKCWMSSGPFSGWYLNLYVGTASDWPTSISSRLLIGEVHFNCEAYCSGVGSQYAASGEMQATALKLVAVQPTSNRRVPPCDL